MENPAKLSGNNQNAPHFGVKFFIPEPLTKTLMKA
jgi:hypothetical protein